MTRRILPAFRRRRRRPVPTRAVQVIVDRRRLLLGVGTVAVLSVLMSIHFLPDRLSLRVGDASPTDVRAPRAVAFIDTEATERYRQAVAQAVPRTFEPDPGARAQAASSVRAAFDRIRQLRADASRPSASRKAEAAAGQLDARLTPDQLRYLMVVSDATLDRFETDARRLVAREMVAEIRSDTDDLRHAREDLNRAAWQAASTNADAAILRTIASAALRPNSILDPRRTQAERERRMAGLPPIRGEIRAGDFVIRQGEVFTQRHLDMARALGLVNPRIDLLTGLSIAALAAAMVLLVAYYIRSTYPALYDSPRRLFLLALTVILGVFGVRVFGALLGIPFSGVQFGYLGMIPVVAAGMLISVLLNPPIAILVTALFSVQSGLVMNHDIRFSVMTLVSSLVGIYCAGHIRDRSHLLRATVIIAAANVATVWVLGGLLGDSLPEVESGSAWAVAAAAFSIAIFGFGVAVLEKPFGILTHFWLLELSASERPLLRQLCLTAPGTYAHSIMVGNLAEAAAEAIGADPLFCRVASYYHDIGKIRRPHCFVENQRAENIHDRLSPSLSALIIASHVRDGLELAAEYKLPRQIADIVAEHHGTSLIRYFYCQAVSGACADGQADPVLEQHFRYDGPRPQTPEAGIVMLADAVEAAARCIDKPSPARIQGLVETVVHERLVDGQLDECDLTFKHIHQIQAAFARVLSAMLHGRIDYPELPRPPAGVGADEETRRAANGSVYRGSAGAPDTADAVTAGGAESPGL